MGINKYPTHIHVFEENMYTISNTAVYGDLFFTSSIERNRFVKAMHQYLSPVCEILDFVLLNTHYRILVRIKNRKELIRFYKKKHGCKPIDDFFIPASHYLFSQQMANFQVSFVKRINFLRSRKGALMRARFKRILVRNDIELKNELKTIKKLKEYNSDVNSVLNRIILIRQAREIEKGETTYDKKYVGKVLTELDERKIKTNLRGLNKNIPKIYLTPPHILYLIRKFRKKFPYGPNFC